MFETPGGLMNGALAALGITRLPVWFADAHAAWLAARNVLTLTITEPSTSSPPARPAAGAAYLDQVRDVQLSQDQLVCHNLPGKGCVFSINLPRVPVPAPVD